MLPVLEDMRLKTDSLLAIFEGQRLPTDEAP